MIFWNTPWSIRGVVSRDEDEWMRKNDTRRRLKLSWINKELLLAGEHPFRFSFSLLALQVLLLWLAALVPQQWLSPTWINDGWKTAEQLTHFTTVWTIQATMAALVYPIVIAFVAVFLQRRPASEALIHLYMLDSGGLAAGLSSLILVVVMSVQYLLICSWGTNAIPAWATLDAAWFAVNAALTTYFLFRTIDFLRPEVQKKAVHRYAVSVALPRDMRRLFGFQVLDASEQKGWLPFPRYGNDAVPHGPRIHIGPFSLGESRSQGVISVSEPSRLTNVRLWPLRIAVSLWFRQARSFTPTDDAEPAVLGRKEPLLVLPVTPGRVVEDILHLAKVENGPSMNVYQRWLLRRSFVLAPVSRERYGIKVQAILDELAAETQLAAIKGDDAGFLRSYEDFLQLHELLLGACVIVNDDGTPGSWALLPDIEHFFGRRLHDIWSQPYRNFFEAAIQNMANNVRPLQRLCHLVQHIQGNTLDQSPVEIHESILDQPSLMMYLLGKWWTHRVEEQGVMDHSYKQMVKLRQPLNRVYEEVMTSFVSGWENACPDQMQTRAVPEGYWDHVPRQVRLSTKHLDETALMLLAAVDRGDQCAAEWLADVMVKWWDSLGYETAPFQLYGKTDFITVDHLSLAWPLVKSMLGIELNGNAGRDQSDAHLQRAVYVSAMRNYWTDIRLIVIEVMTGWLVDDGDLPSPSSLAAEIISGLLGGRQWRGGGRGANSLSNFNSAPYLTAKARHFTSTSTRRGGYVGRLDHFVERAKRMNRPNMVTSRVYSLRGADDVASLQDAQLALMGLLTVGPWGIPAELTRQIELWLTSEDQSRNVDNLQRQVSGWLQRIDQVMLPGVEVVRSLKERIRPGLTVEEALDHLKAGLKKIQDMIETERNRVLAAQEVDPGRLQEIAGFASTKAFSSTTGAFPLPLMSVETSNEHLKDFTLTLTRVRKGELTRVELDQRASNEAQFFADAVTQQVGAVALWDVLEQCSKIEIECPDVDAYWLALKSESEKISARGEVPILLLESSTQPDWIRDWQYPDFGAEYSRPEGLSVQRRNSQVDGYVCNFNDIEVYVAPVAIGTSVLMSKDSFKKISFTKYQENVFIDPTTEAIEDSPNLVNLKLKFSRDVEITRREAIYLRFFALN